MQPRIDDELSPNAIGPALSSFIRTGTNAVNRVRAECIGSVQRLYVNGEFVTELVDATHAKGVVGLAVSSLAGQFSEVAFDNLLVIVP